MLVLWRSRSKTSLGADIKNNKVHLCSRSDLSQSSPTRHAEWKSVFVRSDLELYHPGIYLVGCQLTALTMCVAR